MAIADELPVAENRRPRRPESPESVFHDMTGLELASVIALPGVDPTEFVASAEETIECQAEAARIDDEIARTRALLSELEAQRVRVEEDRTFLVGATVACVLSIREAIEETRKALEAPLEMITERLTNTPIEQPSTTSRLKPTTDAEAVGERFGFDAQYDDQLRLFLKTLDLSGLEIDEVGFIDAKGVRCLPLPPYRELVNQFVTTEVAEYLEGAGEARMLIVPDHIDLDMITILADETANMRIIDHSQDLDSNAFPVIWREHRERVEPKDLRAALSKSSPTPAMFMRAAKPLVAMHGTGGSKAEQAVINRHHRMASESSERGFHVVFTSLSSTADPHDPEIQTRGLVDIGMSPLESRANVQALNEGLSDRAVITSLGIDAYAILTTLELAYGTIDKPAFVEADGYYYRPANIGIVGRDGNADEGRSVLWPVFRSRNGRTTFRAVGADSAAGKHCGERVGIVPLVGSPTPD